MSILSARGLSSEMSVELSRPMTSSSCRCTSQVRIFAVKIHDNLTDAETALEEATKISLSNEHNKKCFASG